MRFENLFAPTGSLYETYSCQLETSFAENGIHNLLEPNQFRVVLRVGTWIIPYFNNTSVAILDYHFWYQTSSGKWANKHGAGAPAPLGEGVTPASQNNTGWDLGDLEYFYDSDWFVYIITRN